MAVTLIQAPSNALRTLYYATKQCTAYAPEPFNVVEQDKAEKIVMNAIKSGHDSILEHVSFTFKLSDISRACTHQLVRHRMASYAQCSQRYVNAENASTKIPEKIRTLPDLYQEAQQLSEQCHAFYKKCIDNGIPKEDARYFLPEGTFTSIVCTMNCRELIHFFNLRCCYRAQWEIRNVAWGMLKMCRKVMPYVFNEVGPQCWRLGHCPEVRKCYQYDASIDMCSKNKEQKPKVDTEEPTNKSIYENV